MVSVFWTLAGLVIAVLAAVSAVAESRPTRVRVWRGAFVFAVVGLALGVGGAFIGSPAAFYLGSLAFFVGVVLWTVLMVVIYRDDRRTLDPTRVPKR